MNAVAGGPPPLLEVRDLRTYLYTRQGVVKAVDGVSFTLRAGETLGLVGESGSGKTMTCLSLLRLVPRPSARIVGGQVVFEGSDLLALSEREMRRYRGKRLSMVLQDPLSSLNPAYRVGDQIAEGLLVHHVERRSKVWGRVEALLRMVGIPDPRVRRRNFPHELSGGMRQRVVSAIAMAPGPVILLADEPTTSLDVTVQAQYLRLLRQLQQETGLGIIFVTHDLGIVAQMCNRVAVMYAGRVVEEGPVETIYASPAHPYTRALLASLPTLDERRSRLTSIPGEPPDPTTLPPGCPFAPRCPDVMPICSAEYPPETQVDAEHRASCWKASA